MMLFEGRQEFWGELKQQRRMAKKAVRDFLAAASSGDVKLMVANLDSIEQGAADGGGWFAVMRGARLQGRIPRVSQNAFLKLMIYGGDTIRQDCGGDLVLIDGLRALLPKYKGPAITLYRGESARNRSRRTYGLSWSTSVAVGRSFATGMYQTFDGGSVLLETVAPPSAIICKVRKSIDRYAEREYIVDRRLLASVKVIERFPRKAM